MHVGVDLDNTIVCYDALFRRAAGEQGLVDEHDAVTRAGLRDALLESGREDVWIELQGYVYGALMPDAVPFPGALDFFIRCRQQGVTACIISHRTPHPLKGPPYDLHRAAHEWLNARGFYDPRRGGLLSRQVFFEPTPQGKVDRIAQVGCTHFIDDLPKLLADPGFPAWVERILFDPSRSHRADHRFHDVASWKEVETLLWSTSLSR